MSDEVDKPITDVAAAPVADDGINNPKPSRLIRRLFVYISMSVAWGTSVYLSYHPGAPELTRLIVESCNTYNLTIGVSYVLGHTVDRSEILAKLGESFKRG